MKGEPTPWVIELTVRLKANVRMSVEFFAWDSIDKEELSLGSQDVAAKGELSVDVYLTCSDVHLETLPSNWRTEIEIANGNYSVGGFEGGAGLWRPGRIVRWRHSPCSEPIEASLERGVALCEPGPLA